MCTLKAVSPTASLLFNWTIKHEGRCYVMQKSGRKWVWAAGDMEYLKKNYYDKTMGTIAAELGTNKTEITRMVKVLGLRKCRAEDIARGKHGIEDFKVYLENAHIVEKRTVLNISKELGIARKALYDAMEKYGIPARKLSEARKLWWDNATDEQRAHIVKAAHKKTKEMALQGCHPFQVVWREKPEEMRARAVKAALHMCKVRKRNYMTGRTGDKHHLWNGGKTKAERIKFRKTEEHYAWVRAVYERDEYTCQVCGYDKGGTLNAHHLNSYADHKECRHDISNGVTMCKKCHMDYHRICGYGDNTAEQFNEYIAGLDQQQVISC